MRNSRTKNHCANTPRHFKLSWPAPHAERHSPRSRAIKPGAVGQALIAAAALLPAAAGAATPAPHPPARIDLTKVQPKSLLPKHAEHTEFTVEINKLGQVTRVTSRRPSDNPTFNVQTLGNAQQAFIRTPSDQVILGVYRLTYDYDPKTERVHRDVSLVRQGGVNPDAKGLALVLMDEARRHPVAPAKIPVAAGAQIDPRTLPALESVSAPTAAPKPH